MKQLTSDQVRQVIALEGFLDKHDTYLRASRAQYQSYREGIIEDLAFQKEIVDKALAARRQWSAEIATGVGKTIIAARVALARVADGPVIYVCPNRTALGDAGAGIINKFVRAAETFGRRPVHLGRVNELSRANDVCFVTPYALAWALREEKARTTALLNAASCLIVDEAHHFPEDDGESLRVYGAIHEAADAHLRNGLALAMTGTWIRLDGLMVMGRERPDVTVTVQDAVNLGRCPEVYGVQVITDVRAEGATARGDLYDLHLSEDERAKYLEGIAACMRTTWRRYPVPFAGFVRSIADAEAVRDAYNDNVGRGEPRLGLLLSTLSVKERLQTVRDIEEGRLAGYVTCAVGEEALDLPRLEIVHLVRRTRSIARNMQAVGRALRICEGKRRALVIDYQTMTKGIVDKFIGVSIDDLSVRLGGCERKNVVNGGPVVAQAGYPGGMFGGLSMGEERALVCVNTRVPTEADLAKQELIRMATVGEPKPRMANRRNQTTVPREESLLAHRLYNYATPGQSTYDGHFALEIKAIRPEWFHSSSKHDKQEDLLRRAVAGEAKPNRRSEDLDERRRGAALHNYTHKASLVYDEEFECRMRAVRPDWVVRRSSNETRSTLLKMAQQGKSRPPWKSTYGRALGRMANPREPSYDPKFIERLQRIRPDWWEPQRKAA